MNYNSIPLNVGLIDSLTVYLPLNKIKVLDSSLIEHYSIYYPESGLILEDLHPPKPIIIDSNGIKFRFNKVVFPPSKNSDLLDIQPTELIRITLTSKMLFGYYFNGINKDNISSICCYINSLNIIQFNLDTLLNSICNDIDICINYNLTFDSYDNSIRVLYDLVKPTKKHSVQLFPRLRTQKIEKNIGLMFGSRDFASIGTPFCKYYNKTNELLTNSVEFYNLYLFPRIKQGLNIDNLIRKEITLKNSTAKQNLIKKKIVKNNPLKTLSDILNLSPNELTTICNIQLKYYYEKKQFSISSDLSPTDRMLLILIKHSIEKGSDSLTIQNFINSVFSKDEKVQKSLMKKRVLRLIEIATQTDYLKNKIEANSIVNQFIQLQNIF